MKRLLICVAVLTLASPAWAQQVQQLQQTEAEQGLALAVQQTVISVKRMNDEHEALARQLMEMRQKASALDAYLKACDDKPGCTQPAQ